MVATPTGPLIRKAQRQDQLSANQPPSTGPTTGATTTATPNSANPWPRFSGGKESARIDCETGTMPPPARPWKMRKKSSESRFQASAEPIEAHREQRQTDQKEGFAAEPAGQEGARREAHGVGDKIGRHHPGGLVGAHAHVAGDIGQHHIGDRGVEHLHERGKRDQDGDQPRIDRSGFAAAGAPKRLPTALIAVPTSSPRPPRVADRGTAPD